MIPEKIPGQLDPGATRSSRRTFLLMVVLFALPMVLAGVAYWYLPHPSGRTNYGELLDPARPMPALNLLDVDGAAVPVDILRGRWHLIFIGGAQCNDACLTRIVMFRQIRLALGRDLARVQRVYIAPDAAAAVAIRERLGKLHPDLVVLVDGGKAGARAADFFTSADPEAVYFTDPNGNWLLTYAGNIEPKGVYSDLHKLLRLSMIG